VARIAPSILSADFADLAAEVDRVAPESDLLHIDVMDGHFVPNLTIGPAVVRSLRPRTDLYLDCHLMVTDPAQFLEPFAKAGANGCTIHVEVGGTRELIHRARQLGLDIGISANPATPFEDVAPFLAEVDLVLLMTVVPGFGGQKFMPEVLPKIEATRAELDRLGSSAALQVDGGIDVTTAPRAAAAGADTFVAGSAIFGAEDPLGAARRLREAVAGDG
jgi:ribulose-phosphate 3-epimerase